MTKFLGDVEKVVISQFVIELLSGFEKEGCSVCPNMKPMIRPKREKLT